MDPPGPGVDKVFGDTCGNGGVGLAPLRSLLYALFNERGEKLMKSSNIKSIYKKIDIKKIYEPLLIYHMNYKKDKIKLVDVLDNPERHYKEVVNRLISKYNW